MTISINDLTGEELAEVGGMPGTLGDYRRTMEFHRRNLIIQRQVADAQINAANAIRWSAFAVAISVVVTAIGIWVDVVGSGSEAVNSDAEVLGVVLIAMASGWFVYIVFQILRSSSIREETAKEIAKRFRASPVDTVREIGQTAAVIMLFGCVILSVFQVVDLGNALLWLFTGVFVLWFLGFFTHGK